MTLLINVDYYGKIIGCRWYYYRGTAMEDYKRMQAKFGKATDNQKELWNKMTNRLNQKQVLVLPDKSAVYMMAKAKAALHRRQGDIVGHLAESILFQHWLGY